MNRRIEIANIDWDTDGYSPKFLGLPSSVTVETDTLGYDVDEDGSQDLDEAVSDWLSDTYGYLVSGFSYDIEELKSFKVSKIVWNVKPGDPVGNLPLEETVEVPSIHDAADFLSEKYGHLVASCTVRELDENGNAVGGS